MDLPSGTFNEKELLDTLTKDSRQLTEFFVKAADDQTWSRQHLGLMQKIIAHLSRLFLEDNLPYELSEIAGKTLQTYPSLPTPQDLIVKLKDGESSVNSILFSMASGSFQSLALETSDCVLHMPKVSKRVFDRVREFFEKGAAVDLWRHEYAEVLDVYIFAIEWDIAELERESASVLKRYLTRQNFQDVLIKAMQNGWQVYYNEILRVANTYDLGVTFHEMPVAFLNIEFLDFRESAMDLFEKLKPWITHLGFFGPLNDDPRFSKILLEKPDLYGLALNEAKAYSDRLLDIPDSIEELDLAMNPWITSAYLKFFIEKCPKIRKLSLKSLVNIDFKGFGLLKTLKGLEVLDLTKCSQIKDEDVLLICQSTPDLIQLDLEGCDRLTDRALDSVSRYLTKLETLNLSRLQITDIALIDLCHKLKNLHTLNLERCGALSDKGILESVQICNSLRELNISHTAISSGAKAELKKMRPRLHFTV